MRLKTIACAMAVGAIIAACGAGGEGELGLPSGNGGPFSGSHSPGPFSTPGRPGSSIYGNPGPFSGTGSPGSVGTPTDPASTCLSVCGRLAQLCPANGDVASCVQTCVGLTTVQGNECTRAAYMTFFTCLTTATITCSDKGQAQSSACADPDNAGCTTTTGSGGSGGSGGGTGGTGGEGGTATGGTGGSTGGTGGTGGATGGTGGTGGTAGRGGTGGRGGTAGRDAGRG